MYVRIEVTIEINQEFFDQRIQQLTVESCVEPSSPSKKKHYSKILSPNNISSNPFIKKLLSNLSRNASEY